MAAVSFHSLGVLSASAAINLSQIQKSANCCLRKCNSSCAVLGNSTIGAVVRRKSVHRALARDDYSIKSPDDPEAVDVPPELQERDLTGTAYIPIYVMLPLGIINMECEIVDVDGLLNQLTVLKSANVDGVKVECWWGIVEAHAPQRYNWTGYKRLFKIIQDFNLKLQVVMAFHACEGNVSDDDVHIPLPQWVTEIGSENPDIYFTDRDGRRNHECLTWGIDKERVLRRRTALDVYYDYMRSFYEEFVELLKNGVISKIEIGLGPHGELGYPSFPAKFGWKYPGIGEFQCYDKYLIKSLQKAAEVEGCYCWGIAPDYTGTYNSKPEDNRFFCDRGEHNSFYGRFFLDWYAQVLIDHGDQVLRRANFAFRGGAPLVAKVVKCKRYSWHHKLRVLTLFLFLVQLSGIYWWFYTSSAAAQLTAGYFSRFGCRYTPITSMLKKHDATLHITCLELRKLSRKLDLLEVRKCQVQHAAWGVKIPIAGENALACYERKGYNKIIDNAKPLNDPFGGHELSAFTYRRLSPTLLDKHNFMEFERFVQKMHGV